MDFHPEMILAGRRINDSMAEWIAFDVVKAMLRERLEVGRARVLILGLTFKENCPDIRNTKIADLRTRLSELVGDVTVHDPYADPDEVREEFAFELAETLPEGPFEAIVLAVRHDPFREIGAAAMRKLLVPGGIIYDVKQVLPIAESDARI